MRLPSFRTRLALAHTAAIVVVLTLTAFGAYWSLSRVIHDQLDAALLALAETELGMLPQIAEQPVAVLGAPSGSAPPSFVRLDRLIQIVDADGQVLARSANLGGARLPTSPALLTRLAKREIVFETLVGFGEEPVRMVSIPAGSIPGHPSIRAIQVAGSLDDVNNVLSSASILFVVMGIALMLAVTFAGTVLTRRAFLAIDDVVRRAHQIGEANINQRLPHPGTNDEIGRLIETLNEMLARLQKSFELQRRFTADASHELRSPLSRLRMELEVALRRPRDEAEYVETLHSCLEEVERLTLLVEELLTLARIDAGQERSLLEMVCLNTLAEETIARFGPTAEARQVLIELVSSQPVTVRIARASVSMVLTNLLDNALKFSSSGQRVTVAVNTSDADAVLSVSDQGPGVSIDDLPHLFERFYRGSAAPAEEVAGVGLGLAVSQAIINSHGGRIEVANLPNGGAVFTIRLPLATTA